MEMKSTQTIPYLTIIINISQAIKKLRSIGLSIDYGSIFSVVLFRWISLDKLTHWYSSILPFLYGLLLGALVCGLVLAVVSTLWVTSKNKTSTTMCKYPSELYGKIELY